MFIRPHPYTCLGIEWASYKCHVTDIAGAHRTTGGSAVRVDVRVWSGVLAVAILAEA